MKLPIAPLPREAKPFDVVGVGESSADVVAWVDGFPVPDTKARLSAFDVLAGGQIATAVTACARLGWRARYHGFIGEDTWGELVTASLTRDGVSIAPIRKAGVRTRSAVVIVDRQTGWRTILEHRDPNQTLTAADLDPAVATSGRVLMVDATDLEPSIAAAAAARAAGIPTVVDVDRPTPGVERLLAHIDVIITAREFPLEMTGARTVEEGLRQLAARFRPVLAVATRGAAGSVAFCDGQEIRSSAPAVVAIDTTGAGDAFRGGFVSAWLEAGAEASVERLLEYANLVAAMSCQVLGAMGGLPTRQAVDAFVTRRRRG